MLNYDNFLLRANIHHELKEYDNEIIDLEDIIHSHLYRTKKQKVDIQKRLAWVLYLANYPELAKDAYHNLESQGEANDELTKTRMGTVLSRISTLQS